MIKENFVAALLVISRSIGHASSKEELMVINAQIEHLEEEFKLFNIPDFSADIEELRSQLHERMNEFNNPQKVFTQCGIFSL